MSRQLYLPEQTKSLLEHRSAWMRCSPSECSHDNYLNIKMILYALADIDRYDTLCLTTASPWIEDILGYFSSQGKEIELVEFNDAVSPQLEARADTVRKVLMGIGFLYPTITGASRRIVA